MMIGAAVTVLNPPAASGPTPIDSPLRRCGLAALAPACACTWSCACEAASPAAVAVAVPCCRGPSVARLRPPKRLTSESMVPLLAMDDRALPLALSSPRDSSGAAVSTAGAGLLLALASRRGLLPGRLPAPAAPGSLLRLMRPLLSWGQRAPPLLAVLVPAALPEALPPLPRRAEPGVRTPPLLLLPLAPDLLACVVTPAVCNVETAGNFALAPGAAADAAAAAAAMPMGGDSAAACESES